MTTFRKTLRTGVAAALLLAGVSTGAQAFVGIGGLPAQDNHGWTMKGSVVCTECSLADVANKPSSNGRYYQLSHKQGRMVIKVESADDAGKWNRLASEHIWLRAQSNLLQKLSAKENQTKTIEITGIVSNSRTMDVNSIAIIN